MTLDLETFSKKLKKYCIQLQVTEKELAEATGIPVSRLSLLVGGKAEPFGDEILIFADYFKCDFKFFISNEKLAPFEQTEELFRRHGNEFSQSDRWNIQEFLFLCDMQHFLINEIYKTGNGKQFIFNKVGTFYKQHGTDAAQALRLFLGYRNTVIPKDIFWDFRQIGIHVFRRKLGASDISGICIRHPVAGWCILVNYDEDLFRQRFTVAHEAGHALLDNEDVIISKTNLRKNQISEIRANSFASAYLVPQAFLASIPSNKIWDEDKILKYSKEMMVNPVTLSIALKSMGLISAVECERYKQVKIRSIEKKDPELSGDLSANGRLRKIALLERGLSDFYVSLCFTAYEQGIISQGRLAEALCIDYTDLLAICKLYGRKLQHDD